MKAEDRIKALARECAVKGLRLREARSLFDALQGQNREALHRRSIRTQRGAM